MRRSQTILSILFAIFVAFCAVWSVLVEPRLLHAHKETTNGWSGPKLRIVFFSDLHAGSPHISIAYIKSLVSRINAFKPDIVLIGGDIVINQMIGGQSIPIAAIAEQLAKLETRLGIFAVLGNHDWWHDGPQIQRTLKSHKIEVLENQSVALKVSGHGVLRLVGIGDDMTGHADSRKAFEAVGENDSTIVFMHDPGAILNNRNKFDVGFAGHLHGGQIYVPGIGALVTPGSAPREWAKGWVTTPYGRLFVSTGIGTSILPIRLNAPPEFVVLDLGKD